MATEFGIDGIRICSKDPKYFIRNHLKIRTVEDGLNKIDLYFPQEEWIEIMHDNRFSICNKPRQSGITSASLGYLIWYSVFNSQRTLAVISNKFSNSRILLSICEDMLTHLPEFFGAKILNTTECSITLENGSIIIFDDLKCEKLRAQNINVVLIDEIGFCENKLVGEFMKGILPVIASGHTSKVIINSTPREYKLKEDEKCDYYKRLWFHALWGRNDYVPYTFPAVRIDGRDHQWLLQMRAQLGLGVFLRDIKAEFIDANYGSDVDD